MHKFFQQDLWKTAMMSLGRSNFASLYQSRLGRASRPEAIFKRQGGWKMLCRTGLLPNLKTSKNHFVTKIMCHFARKTICCAGNIVELRSTPFMRSIPIEHSRWLQFAPYFACYFQVQNLAVIARFTWLCWFVILSWAPGHRLSTVSVGKWMESWTCWNMDFMDLFEAAWDQDFGVSTGKLQLGHVLGQLFEDFKVCCVESVWCHSASGTAKEVDPGCLSMCTSQSSRRSGDCFGCRILKVWRDS